MGRGFRVHRFVLQERTERRAEADLSSLLPGAGAHVHEPVGAEHRLRVMLHHHHRVALITEGLQRGDELPVVLLVQADGRLVQDIEHINELGSDLRRQADALAFAAGQ